MKTIRGKIIFWMSITVTAALLILGATSVVLNYTSSEQLLEQTLSEAALIAAERVEQELTAYKNVAIDAGATAQLADPAVSVEIKKEIIAGRAALHGFARGNILDSNGISIFDGKDFSDRNYFVEAIKGTVYVSEPVLSKVTGDLTIAVSAPLWENGENGGKVIGVIYFVPPETFLNDIVSKIKVSENSTAYAINAQGITIADVTLDTILQQNVEEEAKTDSSKSEIAAVHARMRKGESGFGSYTLDGIKKFTAYAPINGTDGWSIALSAPQSDFMSSTYTALIVTVVILVVSLILAVIIAFKLAYTIGNPIRLCAKRLDVLAQGDLQSETPVIKSKDETGLLAKATETIVSSMHAIITDADYLLDEIANGNFRVKSKNADGYVGDFNGMLLSMRRLRDSLSDTLIQINQSAEQVSAGSDQVSSGAQALSQGATEQASSVEELAATITEISSQVKENAQSAQEGSALAESAGDKIEEGNRQMQELIKAISEISDKSGQIGKIIKTIEDIAFQTNILALNAAVEAARAGTAGKGFAVVADEVRNLASKSAEASKSTAALIEGSIHAVEIGTRLAGETAQTLTEVVKNAKQVVTVVDGISQASNKQASSIMQVTQGIDQISSVVQTNSATAEESAAASEELSGQAQLLKNLVDKFQLLQTDERDYTSAPAQLQPREETRRLPVTDEKY